MLNIFKEKPGGLLKYHNLWDWWIESFSKEERRLIVSTYSPLFSSGEELIKGLKEDTRFFNMDGSPVSPCGFLSGLAGWFKKEDQRNITYRIIEKAEQLSENSTISERYWLYQAKIEIYYRFRDVDNFALSKAIEACEQQISIAKDMASYFKKEFPEEELPSVKGYHQLAIIREKEGNIKEAINISIQAKEEGWNGDWEKRINKLNKKII